MSGHLCAKCAQSPEWEMCCYRSEVAVTRADMERIKAYTGKDDFYEVKGVSEKHRGNYSHPGHVPDGDYEWVRIVFDRDEKRPVVRHQPDCYCHFLEKGRGCLLPADVRPLYCRLYPFDYNSERITGAISSGCPEHLLSEGQKLLEVLEMDLATGEKWRSQMYREFREDHAEREALNSSPRERLPL